MADPLPPGTPLSFLSAGLGRLQKLATEVALTLLPEPLAAETSSLSDHAPGHENAASRDREMEEHLLRAFLRQQRQQAGTEGSWEEFLADMSDFYRAIDWTQSWIQLLIGFHLGTFLALFLVRKHQTSLTTMLCVLLFLAGIAEPLNSVASSHWRSFASADYFDSRGTFATAVLAGPSLFNAAVCLMYLLALVMSKLSSVKRAEVVRRRNHQANGEGHAVRGKVGGKSKSS